MGRVAGVRRRFNRAPWNQARETWDQYVIRAGHYTEHRICTCCESIIANAEGCHDAACLTCGGDDGGGRFAQMSRVHRGYLTLGAFTDECGHEAVSEEHREQCESFGYQHMSCTWCGDYMHGDRVAAVFWPASPQEGEGEVK